MSNVYKWWKKQKHESQKTETKPCCAHNCKQEGIYMAPKKGVLSHPKKPETWYWFCLEHVRNYNSEWNYFAEMSQDEILDEWYKDITWQRPSWPIGNWHSNRAARTERNFSTENKQRFFNDPFGLFDEDEWKTAGENITFVAPTPEAEAVVLLELSPPFNTEQLQTAYRKMVKKHHPDLHHGCLDAEERIKKINQAYALLKSKMIA